MANMRRLRLRVFGSFRKYVPSGSIGMDIPQTLTVAELKPMIFRHLQSLCVDFKDEALVNDSAIANSRKVLNLEESVGADDDELAILPPVCGG